MGLSQSTGVTPTTSPVTRWWWVRHAPVRAAARPPDLIYGDEDLPADCGDTALFYRLSRRLPETAQWLVSDLRRTRQTAQAISACRGLPIRVTPYPALREMHFGAWQGQTWSALYASAERAHVERFWRDPVATAPPGGESFADLQRRVTKVVAEANTRFCGQDLIIIAHAGPIRAVLMHTLGISCDAAFALQVDCLHMTRLDHRETAWRAVHINAPP